eukprot:4159760-Ditylum_brightwellii.AAC.1
MVREHRQPGAEDPPLANVRWAMDNWSKSKPIYDKLLRLRQYPYGTMELKRCVPPFVTFGRTKKPTNAMPKGFLKKERFVDGKLSLWAYMNSSIVFVWILAGEDRWNHLFA